MKRITCFFTKIGLILFTLILILSILSPVFTPKFFGLWPTTSVVNGLYELEDDSIDVLFLGSSHVMTAVSPMQIYEETGITSYNLGTEQQSLFTSYYLLKEALQKNQNPQVVVLEIYFLFPHNITTPINSDEQFVRKTFDSIKWSPNKWEAVRNLCSLDDNHTMGNYLLPFLRYHSRWSELTLTDFTYLFQDKSNPLKGFSVATEQTPSHFSGFTATEYTPSIQLTDTMVLYFKKIVTLCNENNISLVLIKTPCGDGSFQSECHDIAQEIAAENGLVFIEFNEKSVFTESGLQADTDYLDTVHTNYYGAEKISHYLAS